jgi:phage shock protein PspC (stress-responsive transcriptional regulator)
MNKVVNIEIARQVFWIEESAYVDLTNYFEKIRKQLANDECASEIYDDIELRVAELLFEIMPGAQKAITAKQLNDVIQQIGFIDSEITEEELPRKSYLDPKNKILAGVCAGLAVRLGVSAFVLRVLFIALTGAFGLGVVLYLIFLISLDTNISRNAALASQGKAQTARHIASFEEPNKNSIMQLQKIIFLPFTILGSLLDVITGHFQKRSNGYRVIIKNVIAATLFVSVLFFTLFLVMVNDQQLIYWPISLGLSIGAMYVVVLILSIYMREYYLPKPNKKINTKLKLAALIPVVLIAATIVYLENEREFFHQELVEKGYLLDKKKLLVKFNEQVSTDQFSRRVKYIVKTNSLNNKQIKLDINYSGYGRDGLDAKAITESIEFLYSYNDNQLLLDEYWKIRPGVLHKSQRVTVTIEVPQNIIVDIPWALTIDRDTNFYHNIPIGGEHNPQAVSNNSYQSSGVYLHEYGDNFKSKLSKNEKSVLVAKFCEEFFIGESWNCDRNIRHLTNDNYQFDPAFMTDIKSIELIRKYLLPDRSIFVSNLNDINTLVDGLSIKHSTKSELQEYIEYLLSIKSPVKPNERTNPG